MKQKTIEIHVDETDKSAMLTTFAYSVEQYGFIRRTSVCVGMYPSYEQAYERMMQLTNGKIPAAYDTVYTFSESP